MLRLDLFHRICFIGSKKLFMRNKLSDNDGHILILDVDIDDENFILINLYNPNTEVEQLKILSKLTEMLTKFHLTQNNNIICAGDFNLFNVKLRVPKEIQFLNRCLENI